MIQQITEEVKDVTIRWEMIKMQFRGNAIQTLSQKKRSDNNKLLALEKKPIDVCLMQDKNISLFSDYDKQKILIQKDIDEIRTK